jgi:enterochelin esterase-like enzyme
MSRRRVRTCGLALALACGLTACSSSTPPLVYDGPPPTALPTPLTGWDGKLFAYSFPSAVAGIADRGVTVLVPPGYGDPANASHRYPVLYMHDGQNCLNYDPFNHGGWQVHTVSYDLVGRGLMAPAIVVMVANGGVARTEEYFPGAGTAPGPTADGYLDFLEQEVIPFVDVNYRTQPDAAHRAIGGSSYGGVISLYAGWTRTSTYGIVMAMSPAFWRDPSVNWDFESLVTAKKPVRVYLDSGTVDWGGGDDGNARTTAVSDLLASNGWTAGVDLQHAVGQGHNHSEEYWRARLRPSTAADTNLGPNPSWPGALVFVFPP